MVCGICLESFDTDSITLPCDHRLHLKCAAQFFLFQRCRRIWNVRCPYCRARIHEDYRFNVFAKCVSKLRKERKLDSQKLKLLKAKLRTNKLKSFVSKLMFSSHRWSEGEKEILQIKIKHLEEKIGQTTRLIFKIQWCVWSH